MAEVTVIELGELGTTEPEEIAVAMLLGGGSW
jgi:hypothetical protein